MAWGPKWLAKSQYDCGYRPDGTPQFPGFGEAESKSAGMESRYGERAAGSVLSMRDIHSYDLLGRTKI